MENILYADTSIVFSEVPDEITLAINIAGCPIRCPDCHSKYLWKNKGILFTTDELEKLIRKNEGITCIALMGGDSNHQYIEYLFEWIKRTYKNLLTAWYSGKSSFDEIPKTIIEWLDYLKLGPYIKEYGDLKSKTTNQRFYKIIHTSSMNMETQKMEYFNIPSDITFKFWKS